MNFWSEIEGKKKGALNF